VLDEPVQLLTGPAHEFAAAHAVTPAQLTGHRIWMPGIPGTEWAAYYEELAAAFGLTIEATGPEFSTEPLLDTIADSSALATFVGEQTRLAWPADDDLRRIAVHGPTPVPHHRLAGIGLQPCLHLLDQRRRLGFAGLAVLARFAAPAVAGHGDVERRGVEPGELGLGGGDVLGAPVPGVGGRRTDRPPDPGDHVEPWWVSNPEATVIGRVPDTRRITSGARR
jgi:hypothetical protein